MVEGEVVVYRVYQNFLPGVSQKKHLISVEDEHLKKIQPLTDSRDWCGSVGDFFKKMLFFKGDTTFF